MTKLQTLEGVDQLMRICKCLEIWGINRWKKKCIEDLRRLELMLLVEGTLTKEGEAWGDLHEGQQEKKLQKIIITKMKKKRKFLLFIIMTTK